MADPLEVISSDGTRIACYRSGSGPALVFVNGALSDHNSVTPLIPYLETRFTILSYDRRGRGGSGDSKPYSVEKEIEDLKAVASLAEGEACFYGHSSGGILLLRAALSGLKAGRLVLHEPPFVGNMKAGLSERISSCIERGDREGALTAFLTEALGFKDEMIVRMKSAPHWQQLLSLAHTLLYDMEVTGDGTMPAGVSGLEIPSLVLLGGSSPQWMREPVERLAKALPKGELVVLPGQGHSAAPEILSRELIRFLG